ncbi:unnamed protein product [Symbiodinium sp. CCMP2592]|nr:unnamed protein product [Symbiodinium sp. CCMP2592]
MHSRNDLVRYALQTLSHEAREHFARYADALSARLEGNVSITFPPPPLKHYRRHGPAEELALQYLQQGSGSFWTAMREIISLLEFEADPRPHAHGLTLMLGAYNKGGLLGLNRATTSHQATTLLLNTAMIKVASQLQWTSLAINVNNLTEPHVDKCNGDLSSLLLGVSHHTSGGLWTAAADGHHYVEVDGQMMAGTEYPTSASAVMFPGRTVCRQGGDRVTIVAYTIRRPECLLRGTVEYLEGLGFVVPTDRSTSGYQGAPLLFTGYILYAGPMAQPANDPPPLPRFIANGHQHCCKPCRQTANGNHLPHDGMWQVLRLRPRHMLLGLQRIERHDPHSPVQPTPRYAAHASYRIVCAAPTMPTTSSTSAAPEQRANGAQTGGPGGGSGAGTSTTEESISNEMD